MTGEENDDNKYSTIANLFFDYGYPAKGATLRPYSKDFGPIERRLGGARTNQQGQGHFKILEMTNEYVKSCDGVELWL